jgi:hypothetical protein
MVRMFFGCLMIVEGDFSTKRKHFVIGKVSWLEAFRIYVVLVPTGQPDHHANHGSYRLDLPFK